MKTSRSQLQDRIPSQEQKGRRTHVVRSDSLKSHQSPQREASISGDAPKGRGPQSASTDDASQTHSIDRDRWRYHLSHALRPSDPLSHALRPSDHLHWSMSTQASHHHFGVRTPIDATPGLVSRQLLRSDPQEHARHLLSPDYFTVPSSESFDHTLLPRLRDTGRMYNAGFPISLRSTSRVLPYDVGGHNDVLAQVPYDHRGPLIVHKDDLFVDAAGRIGFRTASTTNDLIRTQYLDESSLLAEPSPELINTYMYDPGLIYEARARALTRRLATESLIHKRALSIAGAHPESSIATTGILDSLHDNRGLPLSASRPNLSPLSQALGKAGTITGLGPTSATRPKAGLAELLPYPVGRGSNCHFSQRICVPLATDEDENWLSEFLCFVRADLVEIFRATEDDVQSRNSSKKVVQGQVGIRCRYCAHMPPRRRACRSSSYPFTLSRIYQSLTMMLRDHFGACYAIPAPIRERFLMLKGKTAQGATGSNNFWEYSAKNLGLIDSEFGIWVDDGAESINIKEGSAHRGVTNHEHKVTTDGARKKPPSSSLVESSEAVLVVPRDRALISDFLYNLMDHVQLIKLEESEKIGNRKNLPVGIAGIGCKYCCEKNRKGFCRIFPARRRTLPRKINDLYDHVRRCPLCPKESREKLKHLKNLKTQLDNEGKTLLGEKDFFDRLWDRMSHWSIVNVDSMEVAR